MSTSYSPKISYGGLQVYYDVNNVRSYAGEPTTNLLPDPKFLAQSGLATGWRSYGASYSISTTEIYIAGTYSQRLEYTSPTDAGGGSMNKGILLYTNDHGGDEGDIMTLSWYGKGWQDHSGISIYQSGQFTSTSLTKTTLTGGWMKFVYTGTRTSATNGYLYIRPSGNSEWSFDCYINAPQLEIKPHATQFTATTRSTTDGLKDLSGNGRHADLISGSYDSTAQLRYNADTSGNADVNASNWNDIAIATPFDIYNISMWVNTDATIDTVYDGYYPEWLKFGAEGETTGYIATGGWTGGATDETFHIWNSTQGGKMTYIITADWHYFTWNWNGSSYDCYIDAVQKTKYAATNGGGGGVSALINSGTNIRMANNYSTYSFRGYMDILQLFNSQKTPNDILNNYNAQKARYQ